MSETKNSLLSAVIIGVFIVLGFIIHGFMMRNESTSSVPDTSKSASIESINGRYQLMFGRDRGSYIMLDTSNGKAWQSAGQGYGWESAWAEGKGFEERDKKTE